MALAVAFRARRLPSGVLVGRSEAGRSTQWRWCSHQLWQAVVKTKDRMLQQVVMLMLLLLACSTWHHAELALQKGQCLGLRGLLATHVCHVSVLSSAVMCTLVICALLCSSCVCLRSRLRVECGPMCVGLWIGARGRLFMANS